MDTQIKANPSNGNGNGNNKATITGHLGNIEDGDYRLSTNEATGITTPGTQPEHRGQPAAARRHHPRAAGTVVRQRYPGAVG